MDLITPLLVLIPLLLMNKTKSSSISNNTSSIGSIINGKFVPKPQPSFESKLDNILTTLEKELEIKYLRDFFMGVAYVESRFHPSAITYEDLDDKTWANIKKIYKTNKYIVQPKLWFWTAGLTQLFPSTALKTADYSGINNSPLTLFDPLYSIAYSIDLASRLNKSYNANNWFEIRLGWKSLTTLKYKDPNVILGVENRIIDGIEKSGGNSNILYEYLPNNFSKYRSQYGFKKLLKRIQTVA